MADLKAEFKEAWILSNDDSSGPLAKVPRLLSDIAMDMVKIKMTYWEHYGWLKACTKAICGIASTGDYSTAQAMTQWLYARLPKGADRMPCTKTLVEYAQAQFPYDEINRMSTMLNVMEADGLI